MTLERSDSDHHRLPSLTAKPYGRYTAKWLLPPKTRSQKQKAKLKRKPKEKHCALQHPKATKAPAKTKAKKSRKRARVSTWPVRLTTC